MTTKKHTAFTVPIKFASPEAEAEFAAMLGEMSEADATKLFETFAAQLNGEALPEGVEVEPVDLDDLDEETRAKIEERLAKVNEDDSA